MVPHVEVSSEHSMFKVADIVAEQLYVLVRDATRKISGIITASDLTMEFKERGEPFLLLGEIENHVRGFLEGKFTPEELAAAIDPDDDKRQANDASDLTLGECVRLIESPDRWKKLNLPVDRAIFAEKLGRVREIRNDVMHFSPDPVGEEDLAMLREFSAFVQRLRRLVT